MKELLLLNFWQSNVFAKKTSTHKNMFGIYRLKAVLLVFVLCMGIMPFIYGQTSLVYNFAPGTQSGLNYDGITDIYLYNGYLYTTANVPGSDSNDVEWYKVNLSNNAATQVTNNYNQQAQNQVIMRNDYQSGTNIFYSGDLGSGLIYNQLNLTNDQVTTNSAPNDPSGWVADANGNLYFIGYGNMYKWTKSTGVVSMLGSAHGGNGSGTSGSSPYVSQNGLAVIGDYIYGAGYINWNSDFLLQNLEFFRYQISTNTFTTWDLNPGSYIYNYNGTNETIYMGSNPTNFVVESGKLYFIAGGYNSQYDVVKFKQVYTLDPNASTPTPTALTSFVNNGMDGGISYLYDGGSGNFFFYTETYNTYYYDFYQMNSSNNTLTNISNNSTDANYIIPLAAYNGYYYYMYDSLMYKTNIASPVAGGASRVGSFTLSLGYSNIVQSNDKLYVGGSINDGAGQELCQVDLTNATATRLTKINASGAGGGSFPSNITYDGSSTLYFWAWDGGVQYGTEVYKYVLQSSNHAPAFTGGSPQTLTVCENASATSINSYLTISDADNGQTETWTVTGNPSNGSVVTGGTQSSNGSSVTPSSFTYQPNSSYSGSDAFTIQVSDGNGGTASTTINVTVTASVTPAISISPATSVSTCSGTPVNFSIASQSNQGTAPTYQWLKGTSVVSTGTTYNDGGTTGGSITCVLTSNAGCVTSSTATSAATVLSITSQVTPSISISPATSVSTCSGTPVNFSIASQSNQGTSPTYQWYKGTTPVSTATTYNDGGTTGGSITCVLTSNAGCVTSSTATSAATVLSITSQVTPSISISPATSVSTCSGTPVNFSIASQSNQGTSPTYQWYKGTTPVSTATTYNDGGTTGGSITCVLTSNAGCVTSSTATSAATVLSITSQVTPSISISPATSVSTCSGTPVNFSIASQSNQGTSPTYQWYKGTTPVSTATTYNDGGTTGGSITCVLTSNAGCVTSSTATSAATTLSVTASVTPAISISPATSVSTCSGTPVNFSIASQSNQGTSPTYQWLKGTTVVSTSTTYSDPGTTGGSITCVLTSNATCATSSTATSAATTLNITSPVAPAISISPNPTAATCSGTPITFSIASQSNQGTAPTYQWLKGTTVVSTGTTYSDPGTIAGSITCTLTSNATCISTNTATSAATALSITIPTASTISIIITPDSLIVPATTVKFTANITNGGTTPHYQWKKNGVNITGATGATYSTNTLINGDAITCVLTSNSTCVTTTAATSNKIKMTVNSTPCPTTIASPTPSVAQVCSGGSVPFSITSIAANAVYKWQYTTGSITTVDSLWNNFGTNSTSATLSGATQKTYVRLVVKLPGCATVSSPTALVNIDSVALNVTASSVTASSALISWNAINGATYSITANGHTYSSATNSYTVTGLSGCTNYNVTVAATGGTCANTPTGSVSITTAPVAIALTLTAGAGGTLVANWNAGVGPYKLYYGQQTAQQNLTLVNVAAGTTSYTIAASHVASGASYMAYVVDAGSTCTPIAQSKYAYYNVAGGSCTGTAPVVVSPTSTATTFTINWTGAAALYQIYYKNTSGNWVSYSTSANTFTITGASPNTCYPYYVVNKCGTTFGLSSPVDTVCTPAECAAPLNLVLSQPTCKGFTATWNTAAGAANYQVYCAITTGVGTPTWNVSYASSNAVTFTTFGQGTTVAVYVEGNCTVGGRSIASNIETMTTLSVGCKDNNNLPLTNTSANTNAFSVYPNPNTGTFKVLMNTLSTNTTATLDVMDVLGRTIYTTDVTNNNGVINESIDLNNAVPSGIYMVRVRCGNDTHIAKVEIQK